MTDQTAHDVTNEERMLARKWAKSIESRTETWTACTRAAVRVILDAVPTPPTLADMTKEERDACQWMQADVKGYEITAGIIAKINPTDAHLIASDGETWFLELDTVTPRPDLPRMEWPSDKKPAPAPALPDGWRLAEHEDHGRVIVTNPTPDPSGHVYFVLPVDDPMGYDWLFCDPDDLTYIDADQ